MPNGMVLVRDTAGGKVADVDFGPNDTIQDLHNNLLADEFLGEMQVVANVGGNYEFTLTPDNLILRPNQIIADLPLTKDSVIEVQWSFHAGGGHGTLG